MKAGDGASERASADFGFERVALDEKQGRVDSVFHSVARRYDVMNDLMSAGLHRAWKAQLVSMLRPPHEPGLRPSRRGRRHRRRRLPGARRRRPADPGDGARHQRIDAARRRRARARPFGRPGASDRIAFVTGNAESLPLPDAAFDAYTIAFGIRNVPRIETALAEARRVLKPGGRFLCLEFSAVDIPLLDRIYDAYSFTRDPAHRRPGGRRRRILPVSRRIDPEVSDARRLRGDDRARRLPPRHRPSAVTGGIVAIHSGWKVS